MKHSIYYQLFILFLFIFPGRIDVLAQKNTECKVLLETISDHYEGKCKKGFAHGKGKATGVDTYEGKFKNGYPNGTGTYTWSNGDIYEGTWKDGKRDGKGKMYYNSIKLDSVLYAYWKEDTFAYEVKVAPYQITYKTSNLTRVSFRKISTDKNKVELIISTEGRTLRDIPIDFIGSSGVFKSDMTENGYENVYFPFEGKINFSVPNKLSGIIYTYTMKFVISEPGNWKIYINI